MLLRDRVNVLNAPLISGAYGSQDERDWENATRADDQPAEVQPLSSSEDVVMQQRTVTRWRVVLYPSAPLEATSRVEWHDGTALRTFEVDGDVEVHKRRGVVHHQEAVLSRVEGG